MRFSTSGSVRRLDLTLLADAIAALREEWAGLRFGADGAVVNPLTGEPFRDLVLVEGQHRVPGARYEMITRTPVLEPDPEKLAALDAEMLGDTEVDWTTYYERRREISVPSGAVETMTTSFTPTADDPHHLAFTITDPKGVWSVDVDIVHARLPRIELAGTHDATAMIAAEGAPGCLARLFGGIASGTATIDLAALDRRGRTTLAEASGRFNRFRGSGSVDLKPSARAWDVDLDAKVKAKGLGRPLLWFFGSRLRTGFDTAVAGFWPGVPAAIDATEAELREFAALAAREGGVDRVVHHTLWEDGYADRVMPN